MSSLYGQGWTALNLADGSTAFGWSSAQNAAFPHSIVFELPQPYAIASVAVDNTGDQDGRYPGISSKGVTVYGSTISATEGFTQLVSFEAPRGGRKETKLASSGRVELYGIYFDSDSATIKPESEKTLNEILTVLQAQPSLKLLIAGHTDSTNTDDCNLKLSQLRAESVVSWLAAHGVAVSRLTAKGFGKSQPVADNATAAGRALNRRV